MSVGVEVESDSVIPVLHAEDDTRLAELTGTFLEREAAVEIKHAEDGAQALSLLDDHDFECIVSDYDMPGMTGLELLDAVRDEYPDLPFILFTGKGSEEVASDAISKGVTDYLQKETGTNQYAVLANRIENAVEGYRTERELERRVRQLRESERRFRTLVSNLPGMVYRCKNEPGWPMSFVSDGAEALTGYDPEAFESDEVIWGQEVIVEEHRDELWEDVQDAVDERRPFQVEYAIQTKGGERKWVWERGRGIFERGELRALEGVITDVTDEHELVQELRRERDLTQQLFETSPVGILVTDLAGAFQMANDRTAAILGESRDTILDRTYDDESWALETPEGDPLPNEAHAFSQLKRKAVNGESGETVRVTDVEHSVVRGDGSRLTISINGAPLYDDDGNLELLVFTIDSIDEDV